MAGRWLLLGFALLFGVLTVSFVREGNGLQALIAGVQALTMLALFYWYSTRDERSNLPG